MRQRGLGTIFWALVFIATGTLWLLYNFGHRFPIWETLALYWPVLLIVWGLLKIADYYRFRGQKRSLFSAGEVVLLILVVLGGSLFTAGAFLTPRLVELGVTLGEDFNLFDLLGENHEFSSSLEAEVGPTPQIEIQNAYGSVEVTVSDTDRMLVTVEQRVRAATREEAERLSGEMRFTITEGGGQYVVASNRDALDGATRRRFTSSLRIEVPRESSLGIRNESGAVRIADLSGDQTIENQYGPSSVRSVSGNVRIDSRYGAVEVEAVRGDVIVDNRFGSVNVSSVDGNVEIENRQGPVRVVEVSGESRVTNRYSQISMENVAGGVRVEGRNNGVDISGASGGVEVETLYRDVSLRNASGPIVIVNRHGDTRLSFETPPEDDISITGEYSDVRVQLPSNASFSVDAQIRSGSFDSEFEGIDTLPSGRNLLVSGGQGTGGPRITINAERSSVRLAR